MSRFKSFLFLFPFWRLVTPGVFGMTFLATAGIAEQSSTDGLVHTWCGEPELAEEGICYRERYTLDESGELRCGDEQHETECCGFSGRLKNEPTYWYDEQGSTIGFVLTSGTCVSGRATGVWQDKFYDMRGMKQAEIDDLLTRIGKNKVVPTSITKGEYQFGLPVKGHFTKEDGMVKMARCYQTRRMDGGDDENPQISYVGTTIWGMKNVPATQEPLKKPEKPTLEGFLRTLVSTEKPVFSAPDKPGRDDYGNKDDFREAMKAYQSKLREAKSDFSASMKRYKQERKSALPEAKVAFAAAMSTYKQEMASYTKERKRMSIFGHKLGKLAVKCPKTGDTFCELSSQCERNGACVWSDDARWAHADESSSQHQYRDDAGADGCIVAKSSHCRTSYACDEQGRCAMEKGNTPSENRCVALSQEDCVRSSECQESGKCTLLEDACVTVEEIESLALKYLNGDGVDANHALGVQLLQQACDGGVKSACEKLFSTADLSVTEGVAVTEDVSVKTNRSATQD